MRDVFLCAFLLSRTRIERPVQGKPAVTLKSLFAGIAFNQLGEFESGATAAWLGAVPAVIVGGIGTLVVVLLWIRLFPELYNVDRLAAIDAIDESAQPA